MKFFTIEKCEMLAVTNILLYPQNEEMLKRSRENSKSVGRDYDVRVRENFIQMKPLMLKYLPEDIKSAVFDESFIPSEIPNPDLLDKMNIWVKSINVLWKDTFEDYKRYYETIEKSLPESLVGLKKECNLHDCKIVSIARNDDEVKIELESGGFIGEGLYTVTFKDVKLIDMPFDILGNVWVYDEIHLSDLGKFDFQVLLDSMDGFLNKRELRIVADDILIENKINRENAEIFIFNLDSLSRGISFKKPRVKAYMNPSNNYCEVCGNLISKAERFSLYVDYDDLITNNMEDDFIITDVGYEGIIVREKLKELFIKENITGISFLPIYYLEDNNRIIEGFYHLKLEEIEVEIAEPARLIKSQKCQSCDKDFMLSCSFYFKRRTCNDRDVFLIKDWFNSIGLPKKRYLRRYIIISKRMYDILPFNDMVKKISCSPAYLFD